MQKIQLKGHKVTLYDSIDEMPVARYHKFTQLIFSCILQYLY